MTQDRLHPFSFLLLCIALLLLIFHIDAHAATSCKEWAEVAKIITYRFRDTGISREAVKAEYEKIKAGDPEMGIAFQMVDYSYNHLSDDTEQILHGAYDQCLKENTL